MPWLEDNSSTKDAGIWTRLTSGMVSWVYNVIESFWVCKEYNARREGDYNSMKRVSNFLFIHIHKVTENEFEGKTEKKKDETKDPTEIEWKHTN